MFWIGFTIGIFVGANVGLFLAVMLYSAKAGDEKVGARIKLQIKTESTQ